MVAIKGQRKHTPNDLILCVVCQRQAREKDKKKVMSPEKPGPYVPKGKLHAHYRKEHPIYAYHCPQCHPPVYYSTPGRLISHVRNHHCNSVQEASQAFRAIEPQISGHPKAEKLLKKRGFTRVDDGGGDAGGDAKANANAFVVVTVVLAKGDASSAK